MACAFTCGMVEREADTSATDLLLPRASVYPPTALIGVLLHIANGGCLSAM